MRAILDFARGCAWTGIYFRIEDSRGVSRFTSRVVLDPTFGPGPRFTVGGSLLPFETPRRWLSFRWEQRIPLPHVTWRAVMLSRYSPVVLLAYRISQRFWHSLDGRWGWPSKIPGAVRRLLVALRRERARGVSLRGSKGGW